MFNDEGLGEAMALDAVENKAKDADRKVEQLTMDFIEFQESTNAALEALIIRIKRLESYSPGQNPNH